MTERRDLLPAHLALDDEPFTDDELDNVLTHPDDEVALDTRAGRFEVTDARSAEWTMRKLAEMRVEIAERLHEALFYAEQIERWKEQTTAPLVRRARHFENLLADYAYRLRTQTDGAVKTVKLPSGEVATRGNEDGGKIVLADRDAFLRWVDEVVPTFAESLFTRPEPRPISEIREHVKVVRVPEHRRVEFDDGHVVTINLDGQWIDELEEGAAVVCPVCDQPGRTIRYDDVVADHYRIEIDFDATMIDPLLAEASTTIFFETMRDRAVPGLAYEPNEISVTVKPYV